MKNILLLLAFLFGITSFGFSQTILKTGETYKKIYKTSINHRHPNCSDNYFIDRSNIPDWLSEIESVKNDKDITTIKGSTQKRGVYSYKGSHIYRHWYDVWSSR